MYSVWKSYLEGTIHLTQSRISACENYKTQVAEPAKMARLQKEQQLRKVPEPNQTPALFPLKTDPTSIPFLRI